MTASEILLAAAHAALLVVSLILIRIDIDQHRLPDAIVLTSAIGLAATLGLVAALAGDSAPLGRAAIGGLALFGLYLLLGLAVPAGLGGGDVKLAALLGMLLAWHGWTELALGAITAFIVGGAHAAALLATGRVSRDAHIAFGPWMIFGAWAGLLA
ncbi:prepilin peptidase [Microbacterium sp.]|uniref:prepilin peptidase n=1 Tax=Microbacterium sp. TaxID=51671 RepID=UPI002811148F|nr:prepilin peptidase [Microbacterium sp.]